MNSQVILNVKNETDVEPIEAEVKWYNPEKGYGFVVLDDNSADIFIHFSALDAAGYQRVQKGDRIVCEIGPSKNGPQVLRILEVKLTPREEQLAKFLREQPPSFFPGSLEEAEGEVKWFNPFKGFGFITPDDRGKDIFLPALVLRAAGYKLLNPGDRVLVKVFNSERGREARFLTIIGKYAKSF